MQQNVATTSHLRGNYKLEGYLLCNNLLRKEDF